MNTPTKHTPTNATPTKRFSENTPTKNTPTNANSKITPTKGTPKKENRENIQNLEKAIKRYIETGKVVGKKTPRQKVKTIKRKLYET